MIEIFDIFNTESILSLRVAIHELDEIKSITDISFYKKGNILLWTKMGSVLIFDLFSFDVEIVIKKNPSIDNIIALDRAITNLACHQLIVANKNGLEYYDLENKMLFQNIELSIRGSNVFTYFEKSKLLVSCDENHNILFINEKGNILFQGINKNIPISLKHLNENIISLAVYVEK